MGWYGIDAVDRAFSRTRKALFEPFDFWKWAKLALIIFLLGGTGSNHGGNYGSGTNYQMDSEYFEEKFPGIPERMIDFPFDGTWPDPGNMQLPEASGLIIAGIVLFVLLVLVFSYISSIMEFVFVEALVKNEVFFWAYSRKFLGKGFYLLLIRFALGLVFLVLLGIALLPLIPRMLEGGPDFNWQALVGGFFWFIGVIVFLALLGSAINSFLSLAIPLSIYRQTGILSAFGLVLGNFRKSWQEILVYWVVRFFLGIGIAVLALILFGLLFLFFGLVFLIIDGILYFLFSAFVSGSLLWALLIPFILVELLLVFGVLLLLNVPLFVFLKYHLLSFLEAWCPGSGIPMFDGVSLESFPEPGVSEF